MDTKARSDVRTILGIARDTAKKEGGKLAGIVVDGAKEAKEAWDAADQKFGELDAALTSGVLPPDRFDQNMTLIRGELSKKVKAITNETRRAAVHSFLNGVINIVTGVFRGAANAVGIPI